MNLLQSNQLIVVQKRELAELFGFETRNKYEIYNESKQLVGYCAEQQKGLLGFFLRQLLGHWRSFDLHFYDTNRKEVLYAKHPFRFIFQELHVFNSDHKLIGFAKQRFGILTKKFDVFNDNSQRIFLMRSGFFRFWTFPLKDVNGTERALIQKKWSGMLKEIFFDADNFVVTFKDPTLTQNERLLILALSVFTDLQYFERKAD